MEITKMNNENKYQTPAVTIINFTNEDIIRTSAQGNAYDKAKGDFWNPSI